MLKRLPLLAATLTLTACLVRVQEPNVPMPVNPASSTSSAPRFEENIVPSSQSGGITQANRLLPSGALEIGDAAAPVSILLFTNHSCAYCKQFQDYLPRLRDEFIAQGNVRISILPFALQKYPQSREAAGIFLCAAMMNQGPAVHDLLFRERIGSTAFTTALASLNVQQAELDACTKSEEIAKRIDAQQAVAQSLGVTLVPTYFINGEKYVGLPEYADLKMQIEEELE